VIENVVGSDLVNPMKLEGHVFGLPLVRRRLFEVNWPCIRPKIPKNRPKWVVTVAGHGGNGSNSFYTWQFAMRINWMTKEQLAQAIPPKYTEYIGKEFLRWQST
jgi:DNA (cytosine-5)-methyltransferase 1